MYSKTGNQNIHQDLSSLTRRQDHCLALLQKAVVQASFGPMELRPKDGFESLAVGIPALSAYCTPASGDKNESGTPSLTSSGSGWRGVYQHSDGIVSKGTNPVFKDSQRKLRETLLWAPWERGCLSLVFQTHCQKRVDAVQRHWGMKWHSSSRRPSAGFLVLEECAGMGG